MKIGLYGGTFSPPHIAHVRAAELFFRTVGLDKLWVMPAGIPPHKNADKWGSAVHRLEMSRLAFGHMAEISDYEIKKEGRSYTVETLRHLRELHPGDSIYMLVGEDMFLSLDTWREPGEIMSLCTVVAMRRKDTCADIMRAAETEYRRLYGADIILIDADPIELSSTDIRRRIAKGESTGEYLPASVGEYIKENGLYKNEN